MAEQIDLVTQALGCIQSGACNAALPLLDQALADEPAQHRALFVRSEALRRLGKHADAERHLLRTLQLVQTNDGEIHMRLGLVSLATGRLDDAERSLRIAAQKMPDHADIWQALVQCLASQGRIDEASRILETAIEQNPQRADLLEAILQEFINEGNFTAAEGFVRVMLRRAPEHSRLHYTLGWIYRSVGQFAESEAPHRLAVALDPDFPEFVANLGAVMRSLDRPDEAAANFRQALTLDPLSLNATLGLAGIHLDNGEFADAMQLVDIYDERVAFPRGASRSVVIPVLDYSPGSPFNIRTLLEDLRDFDGEVVCIFNGEEVFEDLRHHPRIDKFSFNKYNVGVARGWNMGINQAEGDAIHILNADLHISVDMLYRLENWLYRLPDALCVGVSAHWMDFDKLKETTAYPSGSFDQPMFTDQVSGQLFTLHAGRLHDAGISFDPRLAPYFGEETDLALKARQFGYRIYAVPEDDFSHSWGISKRDRPIYCFGRPVHRLRRMTLNQALLQRKWDQIKKIQPS